MNTSLLKLARKNFCSAWVPREINRANQRKYAVAVHRLGSRWLLAQQVVRIGS